MKLITFFNEKGGVGKTTMSIMFASWLNYYLGVPVWAMDFDYPSFHMSEIRKRDINIINNGGNIELNRAITLSAVNGFYTIGSINKQDDCKQYTREEVKTIMQSLAGMKNKRDEGYFICDFPGSFEPDDVAYHVAKAGLMDDIIYVVDSDKQSQQACMLVHEKVNALNRDSGAGIKASLIWNKENISERHTKTDWYDGPSAMFRNLGINIMHTRMRDIVITRRGSDQTRFVRSTVCWPEKSIRIACPYIHDLFTELKATIDE